MKQLTIFLSLFSLGAIAYAAPKIEPQIIILSVTDKGFEPSSINVKPGTPVTLKVTRKTDATCATQIEISSKKIKKDLPLNQEVTVDLGKLEKGEIRFACGMNMMEGKIIAN